MSNRKNAVSPASPVATPADAHRSPRCLQVMRRCHYEPDQPTDMELLQRWRGGDSSASEQLFDRHYAAVRQFFRNKVPVSAGNDLVQKTFLACLEACSRFEGRSTFRTFLLGIARHVLIDHMRDAARRSSCELDLTDVVLEDLQPSSEEAIAAKRTRRLLLRALGRLRSPLQLVLELRYWESLSDSEIAEVLDEPLGTIKTRLRAARRDLEDQFTRLAGTTEEQAFDCP